MKKENEFFSITEIIIQGINNRHIEETLEVIQNELEKELGEEEKIILNLYKSEIIEIKERIMKKKKINKEKIPEIVIHDPILNLHQYTSIINIYYNRGNTISESISKLESLFNNNYSNILDEPFFVSRIFTTVIRTNYQLCNYDKAIEYSEKHVKFTEKHLKVELPRSMTLSAILQLEIGNIDNALEKHKEAFKIAEKAEDYEQLSILNVNMGEIFRELGEYKKAQKYYEKSINFCKKSKNQIGEAVAEHNIGLVDTKIGEINEGIKRLEQSIKLMKGVSQKYYCLFSANLAYEYYSASGDYDKAQKMFERTFSLYEEIQIEEELVKNLCNYIEFLLNARENIEEAKKILEKAITLSKSHNSIIEKSIVVFTKGLIEKTENNYGLARESFKESLRIAKDKNFTIMLKSMINLAEIGLRVYQTNRHDFHYNSTEKMLNEAKILAAKKNMIVSFIQIQITQALLLTARFRYDDSIKYLNEVLDLAQNKNLTFFVNIIQGRLRHINSLKEVSLKDTNLIASKEEVGNIAIKETLFAIEEIDKLSKIIKPIKGKDIGIMIFKHSNRGPILLQKDKESLKEFNSTYLESIGIFYSVAIGQGGRWHEGLFGPLPFGESGNYSSLIFTKQIADKNAVDKRMRQKNFLIIVLIMNQKVVGPLISIREEINSIILKQLETLSDISEVNEKIVIKIKSNILKQTS